MMISTLYEKLIQFDKKMSIEFQLFTFVYQLKMEQNNCDCSRKGYFTYFCIQPKCRRRRLCANCRNGHFDHETIQISNLQSLECYKCNIDLPNKQQHKKTLQTALEVAQHMKTKIIEYTTNIVNKEFQKFIFVPIRLLLNTADSQQQERKREIINNQTTKEQVLSEIADEIKQLKKVQFKDPQFIREVINRLIIQFRNVQQAVQKCLQQISDVISKQLKPLSPFSNIMEKAVKDKIAQARKRSEQIEEEKKQQNQKTRANFLQKHGKIIGIQRNFYTCLSSDQWVKRGNKTEEIDIMYLYYRDLKAIPFQLGFFSNLKELYLHRNNITKIENLQNLNKLQRLCLDQNQIEKIEGLESLKQLKVLWIGRNKIQTMEGLDSLKKLQMLLLSENKIKTIEGLQHLTKLNSLLLYQNKISSLQGLQYSKKLEKLNIWGNQIKKIENLENLTLLKYLHLMNNQIQQVGPLKSLTKITFLHLRGNPLKKTEREALILKQMKENGLRQLYLPEQWDDRDYAKLIL